MTSMFWCHGYVMMTNPSDMCLLLMNRLEPQHPVYSFLMNWIQSQNPGEDLLEMQEELQIEL